MKVIDANRIYSKRSILIIMLQLISVSIFVLFLLYPNLNAKWWMIDDHMIMAYLGNDQNLSFSEVPSMILKSEVGSPGIADRYRPFYYILYVTEAALWGNNPFLWYLARMIGLVTAIFISWRLLARRFGLCFAGLATVGLLSHHFWAGIWCLLGPSEIYATVTLVFYSLAYANLWGDQSGKVRQMWWFVLCVAGIVTIGVKENFLFLLPVTWVLVFREIKQGRLSKSSIIVSIIQTSFGLFVIGALLLAVNRQGRDYYANEVSLSSKVDQLLHSFTTPAHLTIFIPSMVVITLAIISLFTIRFSQKLKPVMNPYKFIILNILLIQISLLGLWYSQFIFYSGKWPVDNRYAFPGILAYPATLLNIASFTLSYAEIAGKEKLRALYIRLCIIIISLYLLLFGWKELLLIRNKSVENMKITRKFTNDLARIVSIAKANPSTPIVFVSHTVWDIEPVSSLRRFLTVNGITNPLMLKLQNWSESSYTAPLEKILAQRMEKLSKIGDQNEWYGFIYAKQVPFYPVNQISKYQNCFEIMFSGNSEIGCNNLGLIWPIKID